MPLDEAVNWFRRHLQEDAESDYLLPEDLPRRGIGGILRGGALPRIRNWVERFPRAEHADVLDDLQLAPEEVLYLLAAAAGYGPAEAPLPEETFAHLKSYSARHATFDGGHRISPHEIPQIVFVYGLGVGRDVVDDAWNGVWGRAYQTLKMAAFQLNEWLRSQLDRIGLPDLEPHLEHAASVIRGVVHCSCVEWYEQNMPRAAEQAARRHARCHLLSAWCDKSGWPGERSSRRDGEWYPLSRFLFRGLVGDQPSHARELPKGIFFHHAQSQDIQLLLERSLVCRNSHEFQEFAFCSRCDKETGDGGWPYYRTSPRMVLASEENVTWTRMQVRRCLTCDGVSSQDRRIVPSEQLICGACQQDARRPPENVDQRSTRVTHCIRFLLGAVREQR